ncbi:CHASE2 domain-containing protein [Baaleninema sp.]|uniref:CHASE2 domain-containing protein n=1 Tax=Baaleninema sp. TaxID=3101197 RepID=UPI003CFD787B
MAQVGVLKLVGHMASGFQATLTLGGEGEFPSLETTGKLPPTTDLNLTYRQWQATYRQLGKSDRTIVPEKITYDGSPNRSREDCRRHAERLRQAFNQWLAGEGFRPVRECWLEQLNPTEETRLVVRSYSRSILRLPWHLWDAVEPYPNVEVAIHVPSTNGRLAKVSTPPGKVRILSVLGDSRGIDTESDRSLLEGLPGVELTTLVEPQRQELNDRLWDQPWDIWFFAGHGHTKNGKGRLYINATDSLSLDELKYGLRQAIDRGLQLAIFNSCDGLGLVWGLEELPLPQSIVMREPVPDIVAQAFLKYFLKAFAGGKSFYRSVREARERLQGLEREFPCASWLPTICQHPAVIPPTWESLGGERRKSPRQDIVTMVFTDLVNSTGIKNYLEGTDIRGRNRSYLEEILLPHRRRVEESLKQYKGRVVKTEEDAYFLVFANPVQAVKWSINLQESHRNNPIPTPFGNLEVRIGMHTGSPLHEGSDFIGQEVDYAARVSGFANGKQILLSEVTAALIRQEKRIRATLEPMGERLLKGIGTAPIFKLKYRKDSDSDLRKVFPKKGNVRGEVWRSLANPIALAVMVAGLVLWGRWQGYFQRWELKAYDRLMRQQPVLGLDDRVTVVRVTQEDIDFLDQPEEETDYGLRSLSHRSLDRLISILENYQPRVMGLDIFLLGKIDDRYGTLKQALTEGRLVSVCFDRSNLYSDDIEAPRESPVDAIGFVDLPVDEDMVTRRSLLFRGIRDESVCQTKTARSFSVVLALKYLEAENISREDDSDDRFFQVGDRKLFSLNLHRGGYHHRDSGIDRAFQILLNYRPYGDYTRDIANVVSLQQVWNEKLLEGELRDRIVIIGVDKVHVDRHRTPFSQNERVEETIPGVFVHAQTVSFLLDAAMGERPPIWTWPAWGDGFWVFLWSNVGGIVAWGVCRQSGQHLSGGRGFLVVGLGNTAAFVLLYGVCWGVFSQGGWIPLVPAAMALYLTGIGVTANTIRIARIDR